jgi:hypothetical protein
MVDEDDAQGTLHKFCGWAMQFKPRGDSYDVDFDMAVYITRKDIGPAGDNTNQWAFIIIPTSFFSYTHSDRIAEKTMQSQSGCCPVNISL